MRSARHAAAASIAVVLAAGTASTQPPSRPVGEEPMTNAPAPSPPSTQSPAEDDELELEAVVQIDAEPGGKALQAVWLARDDGERWIVAYRPEPWLRAFEGKRVRASGERWSPEGQAVMATHFRIASLEVIDESAALLVSAGPERTMTGRFSVHVGEKGSKSEGEHYPMFASEAGDSFMLANHPPGLPTTTTVKILAREMQYSKFVAHRGGPMIWVLEIDGKAVAPSE